MARQEQDNSRHGPTNHPAGVVENWLGYNQTPWGRLRLDLVRWQFERWVPAHLMPILDAGCGTGETAIWLASRDGKVVAIDQSEAMLAVARGRAEAAAVKVDWRVGNIPEDIPDDVFELVVCHNLLGYLPKPAAACAEMAERLRPGGYLSVVVSNALALPLHIAARDGDLKGALRAARGEGTKKSEVCQDTLATQTPQQVRQWLTDAGLRVVRQGGIRTVNDYLPDALKTDERYPDLLALEKALSEHAPYHEIGALIHILAAKPTSDRDA